MGPDIPHGREKPLFSHAGIEQRLCLALQHGGHAVRSGMQPEPLGTLIYIDEFNNGWAFLDDCCLKGPSYSPILNRLMILDMLNTIERKECPTASSLFDAQSAFLRSGRRTGRLRRQQLLYALPTVHPLPVVCFVRVPGSSFGAAGLPNRFRRCPVRQALRRPPPSSRKIKTALSSSTQPPQPTQASPPLD